MFGTDNLMENLLTFVRPNFGGKVISIKFSESSIIIVNEFLELLMMNRFA